jgi:hypothetical protein
MSDPVFRTKCPKCGQPTGKDDYYLNRGRPRGVCKTCWGKRNKSFYRKNRKSRIEAADRLKRANPERYAGYSRDYRQRLRADTLTAYGGTTPSCKCCGEDEPKFLAIDHVDGGGNEHRRSIHGNVSAGCRFYGWLRKNGWPPGFQVLCHNCNFAKTAYGECPHKS